MELVAHTDWSVEMSLGEETKKRWLVLRILQFALSNLKKKVELVEYHVIIDSLPYSLSLTLLVELILLSVLWVCLHLFCESLLFPCADSASFALLHSQYFLSLCQQRLFQLCSPLGKEVFSLRRM